MNTFRYQALTALSIALAFSIPAVGCSQEKRDYGTAGEGGGGSTSGGSLTCEPGSITACYSGPTDTAGVGACKEGVKTCAADGSGYSECTGEVLPTPEWCVTPVDDDCDGNASPCTGAPVWAARFGDSSDQSSYSTFVDTQGNILVAGYFVGSVDFGSGPLTSAGGIDMFVAKFSPDGAPIWSKRFGDMTVDQQVVSGVTADAQGNVFLTGVLIGSANFGGELLTSAGGSDLFLVKLDPNGNHLWSRRFGDATSWQWGERIAIDHAGNIIVVGTMAGTLDLGGAPLLGADNLDLFLAKFSTDGQYLWSKRFGDAAGQALGLLAVDPNDNIVISAPLYGTVDMGGGPLTSPGSEDDVLLAKFDPSGKHLWSKNFGDAGAQEPRGLAVDAEGNIVVSGQFSGAVDFGDGILQSVGLPDVFMAKFNPNGTHTWSKRYGDAAQQGGMRVAIDNAGSVIATGHFMSTIHFGGPVLTSAGAFDIFAVKLDSLGNHVWSKRFGGSGNDFSSCNVVGPDGSTYFTGNFDGTFDLGATTLTNAGAKDIFLAKLAP